MLDKVPRSLILIKFHQRAVAGAGGSYTTKTGGDLKARSVSPSTGLLDHRPAESPARLLRTILSLRGSGHPQSAKLSADRRARLASRTPASNSGAEGNGLVIWRMLGAFDPTAGLSVLQSYAVQSVVPVPYKVTKPRARCDFRSQIFKMNGAKDHPSFSIPCPNCEEQSEHSLAWLKDRSQFNFYCHACGQRADINVTDVPGLPEALKSLRTRPT